MQTRDISAIRSTGEQGVALISTLMIMMLMTALMIGFTSVVTSDQRYRLIDRDRYKAFYGAHSGLEKLNRDLANLFFVNVAPSDAEVEALGDGLPVIPDITFATSGTDAYGITSLGSSSGQISTGPYQGLIALKKTYELNSSVRTVGGGEAHLKRKVETVAIPVFQFGIFSDIDLSFHAGPNFNFGGRVHTNGNLFLAQGDSATLTLPEKVTAVREVIRQQLANGNTVPVTNHEGTVRMARAPNSYRNLLVTEGSVTGGPTSGANPSWSTISLSTYNSYIRTGTTGARALNLPLITSGGANTDLVRRGLVNEATSNPTLFGERFFAKASIRILLSDFANDITSLPTVTGTAPVSLDGDWKAAAPTNGVTAYGPVDASHPPIARSVGNVVGQVNGAVSAGTVALNTSRTVTVDAMPAYWKLPATLTVTSTTTGGGPWTVACTGMTSNTFIGCSIPSAPGTTVAVAANATVSGVVTNPADGNLAPVTAATTVVWNTPIGAATSTITVAAAATMPFAPHGFWVENGNGSNVLVTCEGYTGLTFTRCDVPAAIQDNAAITTGALSAAGTGLIGGFLKVEMQDSANVWQDVTMEWLNWGIGAANQAGIGCGDPTPNAILRFQRLRDNSKTSGACGYANSTTSTDWWPNTLFDAREGLQRDINPGTSLRLGGVMHYVSLDIANLSKWIAGTAPYNGGTGTSSLSVNGYTVYFSDRRNNRNASSLETGEYGFEDIVNPLSAAGTPNGTLDTGEDVNASTAVDTYGQLPAYNGVTNTVPPGAIAPLDVNARPTTNIRATAARMNRALHFRRALKLINGGLGNIVSPGLTVVAENPVYVQGDWNANQSGFGTGVATSIISDAVTVLSNAWTDANSYANPYAPGSRVRSAQSYYRFAVIAGKNAAFPKPSGAPAEDFGTDGGTHNFLRMLEAGGGTVNYRGSIATFYLGRQAVGVYKCCTTVYGAPTRVFNFDTNFLDPALLPPLTPVFRDLNSLHFTQEVWPGF